MKLDEAIKRYTDNAEYERTHGNLQGYIEFKQLAEWLKELKRLREQTRWILTNKSKKRPKDNEDVIVQINNGGDRFLNIAHTVRMKHPAFDKDFYWEARHPWDDSSIEAWMPLPEPYKAESEEV